MIIKFLRSKLGWKSNELAEAVEENNFQELDDLLNRGANINSRQSDFAAPIHIAVENGNFEMLKYLFLKGANINLIHGPTGEINGASDLGPRPGFTALHIAIYHNNAEMVDYLISKGANLEIRTSYGFQLQWGTPLHAAITWADEEVVKLLLSAGANVNALRLKTGSTPLQMARERASKKKDKSSNLIVSILESSGGKINPNSNNGYRGSPIRSR